MKSYLVKTMILQKKLMKLREKFSLHATQKLAVMETRL